MFDLYLITPERSRGEIEAGVQRALSAGSAQRLAVLMRARHLPYAEQRALGHSLRAQTRTRGALLLVSADLTLCAELAADGVQLPERGPTVRQARATLGHSAVIGASRHDGRGLAAAARDGASFATLSPVYGSPLKGEPLGAAAFGVLAKAALLPVYALGGIEPAQAAALISLGARGIAAIRAVFDHPDPPSAVTAFLAEIDYAQSLPTANLGAGSL